MPAQETDPGLVASEVGAGAGAGGIVLFGSSAPADLGSLLASLQAGSPGHAGTLVMTDEEGGGIQRMANLAGSLPWPKAMAQSWSATRSPRTKAVAARMASNGVTVDLAPVVDVDGSDVPPGPTNPDGLRSFSGTTSVVSADGVAYMRGLLGGGVVLVLKHLLRSLTKTSLGSGGRAATPTSVRRRRGRGRRSSGPRSRRLPPP